MPSSAIIEEPLTGIPDSPQPFLFRRFDPNKILPSISPPKYFHDNLTLFLDVFDGNKDGVQLLFPLVGAEFSYSRKGKGQPARVSASLSRVNFELKKRGREDVTRWMQQNKRIQCVLYIKTKTTQNFAPTSMYTGFIDSSDLNLNNDTIDFSLRDQSAVLWEQRLFGAVHPAPLTVTVVKNAAKFAKLNITALSGDGTTYSTITDDPKKKDGTSRGFSQLGVLDAKSDNKFLINDGIRYWDLLQRAASIDDVYCFVHKSTLWYMSEYAFQEFGGVFNLTWGENIEQISFSHTPYQSDTSVIIVGFTDTLNVLKRGASETGYLIVESLDKNPTIVHELTDDLLNQYADKVIYRLARYNTPTDEIDAEVRALYRDLASKELTVNVVFSGHGDADIFNQYYIRGTGTFLDGKQLLVNKMSHSINATGGWSVSAELTNAVETPQTELNPDDRTGGPIIVSESVSKKVPTI